jgi:hypothetical protein
LVPAATTAIGRPPQPPLTASTEHQCLQRWR